VSCYNCVLIWINNHFYSEKCHSLI
jgi:hypothetical protein